MPKMCHEDKLYRPILSCDDVCEYHKNGGTWEECEFGKKYEETHITCPACLIEYTDEDGCTAATDEKTSISDHGMCRTCHKNWQLDQEEKKFKEYVEDEHGLCPFCKSEDIDGDRFDYDGGRIFQGMTCKTCNQHWQDEYKLVAAYRR